MLNRVLSRILLTSALAISGVPARAEAFHVKDAEAAIAIAKKVCAKEAVLSSKWTAELDTAGLFWSVRATDEPSSQSWIVPTIPVYSAYPYYCMYAGPLHNILPGEKTQHELDCMHLLLPDCPDQRRTKNPRQR